MKEKSNKKDQPTDGEPAERRRGGHSKTADAKPNELVACLSPSLPHTTIYIRNARQISRAIDNWNDDEVRWASCRWNLFLAKGASKKIARNYNQFFLPSADIFIINGGEEWKCLHSSVSGRIIIFNLAPFGAIHRGKVVEDAVDSALISVRRWARR